MNVQSNQTNPLNRAVDQPEAVEQAESSPKLELTNDELNARLCRIDDPDCESCQ